MPQEGWMPGRAGQCRMRHELPPHPCAPPAPTLRQEPRLPGPLPSGTAVTSWPYMYPLFNKSRHSAYPWSNRDIHSHSCICVRSAAGFDEMTFWADSSSTLSSPGHSPGAAGIWAVTSRITASEDFIFRALGTSSLPFGDAGGRCLPTLCRGHLQQKCPHSCCHGCFQLLQERY